jgi:predicted Zn-dependent peptidase
LRLNRLLEKLSAREYVDETLQQARLVMVWRVPGMTQLDQTYALDVLAVILGQGRMSRLVRDLREDRQLVTHIGGEQYDAAASGCVLHFCPTADGKLGRGRRSDRTAYRRFQTELVAEADIARIRTQVANRFIFGNEKPSDRTSLYGYYQSQLGDLTPALNYPTRIQSLEVVDLQTAAKKYLSPDAYGVITIKPASV